MPDETKPNPKTSGGWSAARQHLGSWGKPALLALVKDLYETAAENRDFIQARCQAEAGGGEVFEKYRRKIVEQFFATRGEGKLKLGEARKAIRDYHKATGNLPGTVELMMTYVESGVKFTHEYGDIDERFYNSVESALDELAALLRGEARELYPKFCDRLASVEQMTNGIGWGFHDFVADVVGRLEEEFTEPVATKPGQVISVAATTEMAAAAKLRWEKIKAAKTAKLK